MTARDIINEACGKLELDATRYDLCEVKSSGEKVLLKDSDISVHSEMSVNGRLYVVPKDHSSRTLVSSYSHGFSSSCSELEESPLVASVLHN